MAELKAIETVYNGYRFRSRLEARWATYFDALAIKYEYEPEGFDLGGDYYLPDFRLTGLAVNGQTMWLEVKGQVPSEREQMLAQKLAIASGSFVMLAFIPPWEIEDAESAGNWLYLPTPKHEHTRLEDVFFAICIVCGSVGLGPHGDPRWASCTCMQTAVTLAAQLTVDQVEYWLHPNLAPLVSTLKTCTWDELPIEAPMLQVEAALKAKQARFEHGETPQGHPKPKKPRPHETPHGKAVMNIFGIQDFEG